MPYFQHNRKLMRFENLILAVKTLMVAIESLLDHRFDSYCSVTLVETKHGFCALSRIFHHDNLKSVMRFHTDVDAWRKVVKLRQLLETSLMEL